MFDTRLERTVIYRSAIASDCWGHRRSIRCGSRHRIWFLTAYDFDLPEESREAPDPSGHREQQLAHLEASGRFTNIEIETLRALVVDRLSVGEIAERNGCSRQAVLARIKGNSRGQGGILRKARAVLGN